MLSLLRVCVLCVCALALAPLAPPPPAAASAAAAAVPAAREESAGERAGEWAEERAGGREGAAGALRAGRDPFVSFFTACEAEVRQFCAPDGEQPLKCLVQRFAGPHRRRFGSACSRWLRARDACVIGVRRARVCREEESASECLRRVPPHVLPRTCRDTSYYRSVLLYGKLNKKREFKRYTYRHQ